jgi:lipopolysaccharide export system permease protein
VSPTLLRYVTRLYLSIFLGTLFASLLIFLAGDLGDRWELFLDKDSADVTALYWNKGLVLVHQLCPVAMLLAAGATVSVLRKRGEWLAMQALGASRWTVMLPVGMSAAVLMLGLVAWAELVVTRAGPEVDRLMHQKFGIWGDFRFYYFPQAWFRAGDHVFNVRGGTDEAGVMREVTVLAMGEGFALEKRYDAETLQSLRGDTWLLRGVTVRRFLGATELPFERVESLELPVPGTTPETFQLRLGRPELMRLGDLWHQRQVRAGLGLGTLRFELAAHERFAFPLAGWVAALLAALLALRPGRRGHLTLTLVEGLLVTVSLFALMIVSKRLALAENLPVAPAAWMPVAVALAAVGLLWKRFDGRNAPRRAA